MKTITEHLENYRCPFCNKESLYKAIQSYRFHPSNYRKRISCGTQMEIEPELAWGGEGDYSHATQLGCMKYMNDKLLQPVWMNYFPSINNYLSNYYSDDLENIICVSFCSTNKICCHITSEFIFEPNQDLDYNFLPLVGQTIYEPHYMNPHNDMQEAYFPGQLYKIYSSFGKDSSFEPMRTIVEDFWNKKLLESPQEMTAQDVLAELEKYKSFM